MIRLAGVGAVLSAKGGGNTGWLAEFSVGELCDSGASLLTIHQVDSYLFHCDRRVKLVRWGEVHIAHQVDVDLSCCRCELM